MIDQREPERVKIVAKYRSGRIVKGFTHNFFANKERFHLSPPEAPLGAPRDITMRDLKAVFFVRDFAGDPAYKERKGFGPEGTPAGRKVEVTFTDGEILVGTTLMLSQPAGRVGFFIVPADPKSNNIKVFAVASSVEMIRRI